MRKLSLAAMLVLLIVNLAISGYAQNPGGAPGGVPGGIPAPNAPVSPEKAKAIRRLLELTGSSKLGQQIFDQMFPLIRRSAKQVPEAVWADIEKEFSADISSGKLIDLVIPIYNRHFTDEDIAALIKFYESPIGQKTARVMPQIAADSMQVGMQWGLDVMQRIQQRLKEKGYSMSTD